jgi:hypothetical protein
MGSLCAAGAVVLLTIPSGSVLPDRIEPYVAMMGIGFFLGVFGHLSRSRWMVVIGILLIFLATLLFPIAINLLSDQPQQPGPTPTPY